MKEENRIVIEVLDKTLIALAGNDNGYDDYKKQIEPKIDYDKLNVIVFPDSIRKISISYVQGMFKEILKKIDKNDFEQYFQIKASTPRLVEKVMNNIKF